VLGDLSSGGEILIQMARRPPADVRRQLRQEANFGCVVCGCPVIQYHHIEFWKDEEHHDPDRMVALCPNHHSHAGPNAEALTPDQLYEYKENPHNESSVEYDFLYESEMPYISFAGSHCGLRTSDEMTVLKVFGEELIQISYVDGMLEFSVKLFDDDGSLMAELDHNEWVVYTEETWDLEYRADFFKIWHEPRDIGLEVRYDSDSDEIFLRGNFYVDEASVQCTEEKIRIDVGDSMENLNLWDATIVDNEFINISKTDDGVSFTLG
jgi:hypothetical protein